MWIFKHKVMDLNLISLSCDIGDIFMTKLEELTGKNYTERASDDKNTTVFTEEGQDIFDELYDELRTLFANQFMVDEKVYELKIKID
jgi:hypothetical protein